MIHEKHAAWLTGLDIPVALAEEYGIETTRDEGGFWLTTPFVEDGKIVNHSYRRIADGTRKTDAGSPLTVWNHPALTEAVSTGGTLVVTKEEWDALAVITAGHKLCCSVPNGAPTREAENPWDAERYEWVRRLKPLLDHVRRFILATGGDDEGLALAADLVRLLGPERCYFVSYPDSMKDLNGVLVSHGEKALNDILATAKPYPVKGLHRMSDFPEQGPFRIIKIGIPGLEDRLPIVAGTFTVVTGWPSHGKTTMVASIIAHLIKHGIPLAVGSFETMAKPILLKRLRAAIYECEEVAPKANLPGPADDLIEKNLVLLANLGVDDDTELDIEEIIKLAIVAVVRDGIRLLILDPWNEIEHKRSSAENETDYIGRAIRLLKRFARDYQCAVWVVVHPRKPSSDGTPRAPSLYDLAGSANWANKADYGLIVHRPSLMDPLLDATVPKVRMGLPGKVGMQKLAYNELTCGYTREDFSPPEAPQEAAGPWWHPDT